jgi:hypothetical protein
VRQVGLGHDYLASHAHRLRNRSFVFPPVRSCRKSHFPTAVINQPRKQLLAAKAEVLLGLRYRRTEPPRRRRGHRMLTHPAIRHRAGLGTGGQGPRTPSGTGQRRDLHPGDRLRRSP